MVTVPVINQKGEKVDTLKLNEKIFNGEVNKPLLQQVVTMYLANKRRPYAKTKNRGEVSGGGKKPWRQKGTGRARHGSIRSPIWRGGGIVFGPIPKDWHYSLPKKIKRLALISSLNARLNEKRFTVIDDIGLKSHKTKELAQMLKSIKLDNAKLIIVSSQPDINLKRASNNLRNASLVRGSDINAYQVLVNDNLLIEKKALQSLEKELTKVA